jgi:RHS repeat-associated protein
LDRVVSANDVAVTRDLEGRITGSVSGGINFAATYDDAGRLASVNYNNGAIQVTYGYDVNDRLLSVGDNVSGASVTFVRDAGGRVVSLTRSNGVNATLTYDAADRLTRIQEGTFLDLQYTLNAVGDPISTEITAPAIPSVTADAKQFAFNAANEISSPGYIYDLRGRLTAAPGHTFAWDGASRLTQIDSTALVYDGFGDLIRRTNAGSTTRYYHHPSIDGRPIVAERNETSGEFIRFYVWMPGGALLYSIDATNNSPSFYHYDRLGSTLTLSSGTGAVSDSYAYSPYGELLIHNGTSTQPFTFIGAFGIRAESGLYQMGMRYYDPITARFLSRDPGRANLRDVRSLDPYVYALGNPMTYIDRNGAEPLQATAGAMGKNDVASPPSLFGAPSDEVTSKELLGAALAFGSEKQIVGTGLGLLFQVRPEKEGFGETKAEQPNSPLNVLAPNRSGSKGDALVRDVDLGGGVDRVSYTFFAERNSSSTPRGASMTADAVVADQQNLVSNRTDQDQQTQGPKSKGPLQLFKKFVKKALALQQAQKAQAEKEAQAKEKAEKKQKKEEAKKAKEDKKKFEENKEKYKKEFGGGTKE